MKTERNTTVSPRVTAIAAGASLLAGAVALHWGNLLVWERPVFHESVSAAERITTWGPGFAQGILCYAGTVVLELVAGWSLYRLFKQVDRNTALLVAWLRVAAALKTSPTSQ